jgi:hypothetical protein
VGLRLIHGFAEMIIRPLFLGVDCTRNFQDIADLFARYFQGVYVNDVSVEMQMDMFSMRAQFTFLFCP